MPSSAAAWPGLAVPLRWAILLCVLPLAAILGFVTTYLLLLLGLAAVLVLAGAPRLLAFRFDGPARLFLAAFLALAVLFAITARRPEDVLLAFNFIAFLFYAPLASVLHRGAAPGNVTLVARLALVGSLLGCLLGSFEIWALGQPRAGYLGTDPIRFANTGVILGFLALAGLFVTGDRWRWLLLLGPLLALMTVLLTGARGAMLAYPVLAFAAIILLVGRLRIGLLLAALVVLALVAAGLTGLFGNPRLASMLAAFGDLAAGNTVIDETVRIRLELYRAGWQAFLQSPLVGHGWAGMMPAVAPFLAEADKVHAGLPHLHNETLNFAVSGGIFGLLVYAALMLMPIVAVRATPRDSQYQARRFGCLVLVLAYLIMGLPDTMLSFELHTALYVGWSATLLAFCRDERAAA